MPIRKLTGAKVMVEQVPAGDAPSLTVTDDGRAFFKALAIKLLGLTMLTEANQVGAVRGASGTLIDTDDRDWTVADAMKLLNAAGTLPAVSHALIWRMPGQGTVLFRGVLPDTPKARRLIYRARTGQPSISLLAALRPEGIVIPKGMCMDVPVKIVEDEEGLVLAVFFRRGKLRDATEEPGQKPSAASETAAGTDEGH